MTRKPRWNRWHRARVLNRMGQEERSSLQPFMECVPNIYP